MYLSCNVCDLRLMRFRNGLRFLSSQIPQPNTTVFTNRIELLRVLILTQLNCIYTGVVSLKYFRYIGFIQVPYFYQMVLCTRYYLRLQRIKPYHPDTAIMPTNNVGLVRGVRRIEFSYSYLHLNIFTVESLEQLAINF